MAQAPKYTPNPVPSNPEDLPRYIFEELIKLQGSLEENATTFIEVKNVEPERIKQGDIVYADGTNVDYAIDYLSGTILSSDVDINGGTIDGTTIGAATPSTGSFTTLAASGAVSGAGVTARFASPGPIGNTSASTGAFTTLTTTGNVTLGNADSDEVTHNAKPLTFLMTLYILVLEL